MPKQINSVEIQGYLGRKPQLKLTTTGISICTFSVATTDRIKNKQTGEFEDGQTHWHRIKVFKNIADWCHDNLDKGMCVNVKGKITYNEYKEKIYTDIIGFHVSAVEHEDKPQPQDDDDIPF